MKRPLFDLLLFIILSSATSFRSVAQTDLYKKVKLGPFQTAFTDTLVYDKTQTYRAYGYDGPKPYFVKIWYPVKKSLAKKNFLSVKDIFTNKAGDELTTVDEQLQKQQKEIILRNYINKVDADPLAEIPNDCACYKVLDSMMALKTKTVSIPLTQKLNYPVIVYHHGSQSNSVENFMMAEYFASNGFIFVSANFHLPYENTLFGLKPFNTMVKNEDENSLTSVLSFAQSITADTNVFFIGHSWGAQMGLRTLDGNTVIKGLVSLETTLESKTDPKTIQEK
jgi:hypothetical protein